MDKAKINETLISHIPADAELITGTDFAERISLQLQMKPGFYYGLYENGDLAFLAHAEMNQEYGDERINSYLKVHPGFAGGFFSEHMWGQNYYTNGTMEDFSAWDDTSLPYEATIEPEAWLVDMIKRVK